MKKILLLLFVVQTSLFANKIDDLKSDIEVQNFVKKQNNRFKGFKIVSIDNLYFNKNEKRIADSLKVKTWEKVDFDNNGETDLLANGILNGRNCLIAIMANGKKINLYSLNKGFLSKCYFPKIEIIDDITTLSLFKICDDCDKMELKEEKLIYKFQTFIEPNYNPKKYTIEKIEYSTTMCFGTCPVFKLTIDSDKKTVYNAEKYNDIEGEFYSTIETEDYNKLIELLNYVDFPNLENKYRVNWTDDQSCTLTITYNNGIKKVINDYGMIGTNGLIAIYSKMFELREKQNWTEK